MVLILKARPLSLVSPFHQKHHHLKRFLSSTLISPEAPKKEEKVAKKSIFDHIKENGPTFMGCYLLAYASTGALVYTGINFMGPEFALNTLKQIGVERWIDLSPLSPSAGNFAGALLLNELIEPIRLPVVLLVTKFISNKRDTNPNPSYLMRKWTELGNTARRYGKFFVMYYTGLWICTGVGCVGLIQVFGPEAAVHALQHIVNIDITGFNPNYVNIGVGLAINEILEPIRFPLGVLTVKPMYRLMMKQDPPE